MKNNYIKTILILLGFILIGNYTYSQRKATDLILGEIKGLPDNIKLFMIKGDNTEASDTIKRVVSKGGKFEFKNTGLIVGKMYFIVLDTTIFKFSTRRSNWIRLIIEFNTIQISGTIGSWPKVDLIGAPTMKVYDEFHGSNQKYISKISKLGVAKDSSKKVEIWREWKGFVKDYIRRNYNSFATPLLIMKSQVLDLEDKNQIFTTLPSATKDSFYGRQLSDYLTAELTRSKVGIGKQIPDFNLATPEGKAISIKELVGQHKLTLIDFWASWCSPCRAAVPHLKEVYTEFKDQGFNIVGIVTAKNDKEVAWKKAVATDQTPWIQGRDIQNASDLYFPKIGIPGYLLVDGTGKIIASDLVDGGRGLGTQGPKITGSELRKTLADLLK